MVERTRRDGIGSITMELPENGGSRREFLCWVGTAAVSMTLKLPSEDMTTPSTFGMSTPNPWLTKEGFPSWTPLPTPIPFPADLALPAADGKRLAHFAVEDELLLPDGFTYDIIAQWGDTFGPARETSKQIQFGFNCDFIGLVPLRGSNDEFYMVVNHEYISFKPWAQGFESVKGRKLPELSVTVGSEKDASVTIGVGGAELVGPTIDVHVVDPTVPPAAREAIQQICNEALSDLGISILHIRRTESGKFEVIKDSPRHKRISGTHPTTPTHSNCSGGVSTWGTAFSCEENFQDYVHDGVDAAGDSTPTGIPFKVVGCVAGDDMPVELNGIGASLPEPQDGRQFGWVCHVDPNTGAIEKLKALGRMRHENLALRCIAGKPLVAYTGDDRRGGHLWKFVSDQTVKRIDDPENVRLFDTGTLFVAKFQPDGTGAWIPLKPSTGLVVPAPELTGGKHLYLPDRSSGVKISQGANGELRKIPTGGRQAVVATGSSQKGVSVKEWIASVENFAKKSYAEMTLGDLVAPLDKANVQREEILAHQLDVLRLDAVLMANAVGGTPLARPEDIEISPVDGSLFIAFTDCVSTSSEGSPDLRIFQSASGTTSRRYGSIFRIDDEPMRNSFSWKSFATSGEAADGGLGFGYPDNLAVDPAGNLWVLTDIPGGSLHAEVARVGASSPGSDKFAGIVGSSGLYMIPTVGPNAGKAFCFALGPVECELCGVTFSDDGGTIFLSVQHPGEQHGTRGGTEGKSTEVKRTFKIKGRDGHVFAQERTVPLGSNWPSRRLGVAPRPSVVAIRRMSNGKSGDSR